MTQPAKAQEPSMEEILASIRRIIADDDASKVAPQPEQPAHAAAPVRPEPSPPIAESAQLAATGSLEEQAADILDLTESMAAPMPAPSPMPDPVPQFRTIDGHSDVSFDDAEPKPAMVEEVEAVEVAMAARSGLREQLLSNSTSSAVDSAFNTLAQTVLVQNARTLEDLVREMLRPMLKSWLDDNLPGMVERLVRAEIERVSRGR
ncbi:MAG TPA: DUF2497 domain-containing protein [Xanthobacteraceae bacterium]|nr:DUF2497 domain-containing protein [Xanthobacteraceae bacterium]